MISSLKTRLLALQALGAIMSDLTDTSPDAQSKCAKVTNTYDYSHFTIDWPVYIVLCI